MVKSTIIINRFMFKPANWRAFIWLIASNNDFRMECEVSTELFGQRGKCLLYRCAVCFLQNWSSMRWTFFACSRSLFPVTRFTAIAQWEQGGGNCSCRILSGYLFQWFIRQWWSWFKSICSTAISWRAVSNTGYFTTFVILCTKSPLSMALFL